jgi:hypothetical protein
MIPWIIRVRSLLVNEDQPRRIKPPLIFLSLRTPSGDLWPELLGGKNAFF